MSATMTLTMSQSRHVYCCPNCGVNLPSTSNALNTQTIIADLQSQVRMLSQKATAAVDRVADYEDEVQRLRTLLPPNALHGDTVGRNTIVQKDFPSIGLPIHLVSPRSRPIPQHLPSLLSSGNPAFDPQAPPTPPTPSNTDLVAALNREQSLRQAAEGRLNEASGELEELSAQLFMQANEMVAVERKARAMLEERVELLEKRDVEKRARLERLEGALKRIERVRGLLAPGR